MKCLFISFFVAFVASLVLTAVVRMAARWWRIVDYPDGERKLHAMPVPLWGGVAVYLALVLGLLVAGYGPFTVHRGPSELYTVLIITAGVVCVFGAVDDCWALSGRVKLPLQVCAVLPIVAFGYYVDRIVAFGCPIELGWVGIPLTVAWLVGCINALNLLDGMDGLTSTVGLLTAAMMAIIATSMGNGHVAVIAIVLAGALAGFLIYNLPPASIFLGDSGSMVIGLVLGVLGIRGPMKTSTTLAITVPAVIMSLPMFDMLLALVRRKLTGRRFDAADRQHVHHRLLDRGLSQWQALCIIGALCLTTGAAATAATIFRTDALAWITAVGLLVLAIRLRVFGDQELALAKRAIGRQLGELARWLGGPPGQKEDAAAAAALAGLPFDQAWAALTEKVKAWNVRQLELILSAQGEGPRGRRWSDPAGGNGEGCCWSINLALRDHRQRDCQLRATVHGVLESQTFCAAALTRELLVFGAHFAGRAAEIPAMTSPQSEDAGIGRVGPPRSEAA